MRDRNRKKSILFCPRLTFCVPRKEFFRKKKNKEFRQHSQFESCIIVTIAKKLIAVILAANLNKKMMKYGLSDFCLVNY